MKQHCKGLVKHHPLQTLGGMQTVRGLAEADVLRRPVARSPQEAGLSLIHVRDVQSAVPAQASAINTWRLA